jgi:hypothetical protein
MNDSFKRGAREGFRLFLPMSVGLIPWARVAGAAMRSADFSPLEAMGMNLIVFAGTAQIGTLPLIVAGAPLVAPDLLRDAGAFDPVNPKLAAALVVILAATGSRNPWLPFIAGMGVLLLLRRGLGW